ncbi:hypothetical protein HELRODRAFT_95422 [Helobdella robusta]|uniref:Aquaporin-9 n=1 Tax=Helobdella robusta TaxID=6412 RepID=T1G957_HELRO|nr:hypothetical protein HELRODRAFT_95422 [Helobdella robusta]ESN96364.1 hypothetical protein HELRODRAFT_95422 [Helobdella robusta]
MVFCDVFKPAFPVHRLEKLGHIKNIYVKYFLAEFLGTCLLMLGGCSSSAQFVLSKGTSSSDGPVWGWGLSVAMACYATMGVSGAHINPAVSFAFMSVGRLSLLGMLMFWLAQYLGAFVGALLAYALHYEAINLYDGGKRAITGQNATAQIFATYPQPGLGVYTSVIDQIIGTMVLLIFVMAISDKRNSNIPQGLKPLVVGALVVFVNYSFVYNCMGAINPARDMGPRMMTLVVGYGVEVFTIYDYFFWVPLVMPHVGAFLGAHIYQLFIGWHHADDDDDDITITNNDLKSFPPEKL